jgi:hypothetical protein
MKIDITRLKLQLVIITLWFGSIVAGSALGAAIAASCT